MTKAQKLKERNKLLNILVIVIDTVVFVRVIFNLALTLNGNWDDLSTSSIMVLVSSAMVALFFAYEKRVTGKKRAIYAVNYGSLMNHDGVWSGYQSFLKRVAAEEQEKRKIDSEGESIWWNLECQFENHYFQRYTAEDAAANIWSCASENAKGIIPLYKPAYNGRQTAQAGIELMPRTFDGFAENLAAALKTTVAEIEEPTRLITSDVSHLVNLESKLPSALVKFVFDADMENDALQRMVGLHLRRTAGVPDLGRT